MEKDKDENVPPTADKKSRIPGYLSPYGILSGMRAILSPKQTPPQPPHPNLDPSLSPSGRLILKDVNFVGGPGYKGSTSSPQGGEAHVEELGAAAVRDPKSTGDVTPKSWTADRASLASESSFVSSDNTSLPDLLPSEASYRTCVESDTDTSIAYESAGENEGNVSAVEDQLSNYRQVFSIDPSAVSSPISDITAHDATIVLDSDSDCSKSPATLVTDVTFVKEDSLSCLDDCDSVESSANVSVSDIVEHFTHLSLQTPQKSPLNGFEGSDSLPSGSKGKGHVTLDSDVSADLLEESERELQNSSVDTLNNLSGSPINSKLNETVEICDSTVTADAVVENLDIDLCPVNSPTVTKEDEPLDSSFALLNSSVEGTCVPVESPPCIENDVPIAQTGLVLETTWASDSSILSDLSLSQLKAIQDGVGDSFTSSPLEEDSSQLDCSSADTSIVTVCDRNNSSLSENADKGSEESTGLNPECDEGGCAAIDVDKADTSKCIKEEGVHVEERLPSLLKETDCVNFHVKTEVGHTSVESTSTKECTEVSVIVESASSEELVLDQSETILEKAVEYHCESVDKNPSAQIDDHENLSVSSVDDHQKNKVELNSNLEQIGAESLEVKGVQSVGSLNTTSGPDDPSRASQVPHECLTAEETKLDVGKAVCSFSPSSNDERSPLKLDSETVSSANVKVSNFDDIPLPAKVQRSFEEILAEQLAAEALYHPQPVLKQEEKDSLSTVSEKSVTFQAEQNSQSSASVDCKGLAETKVLPNDLSPSGSLLSLTNCPKSAVSPSKSLDEVPVHGKVQRSFEEILAAELACQENAEVAVPSFSKKAIFEVNSSESISHIKAVEGFDTSNANQDLDKTINDILASETSTLDAESEPLIESEEAPSSKGSHHECGSLYALMEKCKLQEKDLEENTQEMDLEGNTASSNFNSAFMAGEQLKSDCPNEFEQTDIIQGKTSEQGRGIGGVNMKAAGNQSIGTNGFGDGLDLESEEFISGDLFKDPSAFDFLSLHGGTSSVRDLRKESLYVKFDPLVGAFSSISSSGIQLPTMQPTQSEKGSCQESSQASVPVDSSQTVEQAKSRSPAHSRLDENTSTVSVDKLISLSPTSSNKLGPKKELNSSLDSSPSIKTPAHIMLNETLEDFGSRGTVVTQEDLIKKLQQHQSVLAEQDTAYQERITELENRLKLSENKLQERDTELKDKVQSFEELKLIMKEYEKTISRLVAEKNQEKAASEEQNETLIKDRDQAQQHLNNMEIAFSDLHTKYERLKTVVEAFKKNEEALNSALNARQADLDKMQNMYDMLKSHAVSKLQKANEDLDSIKQKHQQEAAKLKAMVKKLEVKTKALEESLQQKTKENQALTTICDELINKVGE